MALPEGEARPSASQGKRRPTAHLYPRTTHTSWAPCTPSKSLCEQVRRHSVSSAPRPEILIRHVHSSNPNPDPNASPHQMQGGGQFDALGPSSWPNWVRCIGQAWPSPILRSDGTPYPVHVGPVYSSRSAPGYWVIIAPSARVEPHTWLAQSGVKTGDRRKPTRRGRSASVLTDHTHEGASHPVPSPPPVHRLTWPAVPAASVPQVATRRALIVSLAATGNAFSDCAPASFHPSRFVMPCNPRG